MALAMDVACQNERARLFLGTQSGVKLVWGQDYLPDI